jgi:hypothetical protein
MAKLTRTWPFGKNARPHNKNSRPAQLATYKEQVGLCTRTAGYLFNESVGVAAERANVSRTWTFHNMVPSSVSGGVVHATLKAPLPYSMGKKAAKSPPPKREDLHVHHFLPVINGYTTRAHHHPRRRFFGILCWASFTADFFHLALRMPFSPGLQHEEEPMECMQQQKPKTKSSSPRER